MRLSVSARRTPSPARSGQGGGGGVFYAVQKINSNNKPTKIIKSSQHSNTKQNKNKSGATKLVEPAAVVTPTPTSITSPQNNNAHEDEDENQAGWTKVQYKKQDRFTKNVRIGKNTELKAIVATEKKKYLHVWRLHSETTLEAMIDHVKSVCGTDVNIKIEKIKHKTERDYSSFMIGVPEQYYDSLNSAEVWPLNAEFNEWIWFRRSSKRIYAEQK